MDAQEIAKDFPNDFRDLPVPYKKAKEQLVTRVLHEDLDSFYGLSEDSGVYRVYHATVDTKLPDIARDGLKAFYEQNRDKPRIFVTPSPTLALWHAIENRPHDTLRKKGLLPESAAEGKPILLQLQVDKSWLESQSDLEKPIDKVEAIRLLAEEEKIGLRKPGKLSRIQAFLDVLRIEVNDLKNGKEGTNLGIPFPVDEIPAKFIYVDNFGSAVPIKDWVAKK